jgi:hypothetical protein
VFLKASIGRLDAPADWPEALMKVSTALLLLTIPFTANAAETTPDKTPVTQCDSLPPSAAIEVFSRSDAIPLCRQVLRVLEGTTIDDLRTFETAAYLFSAKGYESGQYAQIAAELVDIIRLRGLYDQEPRWRPTIDLAWKSYQAFNGIITPRDIVSFLRSSGPMAKTLSDDGLTTMIIVMKRQRQQGND